MNAKIEKITFKTTKTATKITAIVLPMTMNTAPKALSIASPKSASNLPTR